MTCTWDSSDGWTTDAGSSCPSSHCGLGGRCANHVRVEVGHRTCPSCIGKTRRDLAKIEQLVALDLEHEVIEDGVNSEAMNLLGPSAHPEAVAARQGWCPFPRRDVHPLEVLGRWDLALREQYGPQTHLMITVSRAVDYLTKLLAGAFPHGDEFEEFAKDVRRCRAHLEQVVHLAARPEEGRPCPSCENRVRLRKVYADHDKSGASDVWVCPEDHSHWWTEVDYMAIVRADYIAHAEFLSLKDAAERLGVSWSTLRNYTMPRRRATADGVVEEPPPLVPRQVTTKGIKMYRVAEVEQVHAQAGGIKAAI